ncbi:MAG TPA: ATP-binding cassette domain-containing protein [Miltoncostaeaceae bacterium]|nr:ATP-binding cassette domain-containing protein [Miltoncostaeaceae bacterium]
MSGGPPVLELRGVTKAYGDREVLRGIDLAVGEHRAVALIGASGSGKSTLLRCVDLLEDIDEGDVFLDGEVITDPSRRPVAVRRRLGLVFQAYNLFPHMTVLDNVVLAPVRAHGAPRAEARERARDLLARFGLAGREGDYPDRLSGGQQQRVAIVRALATRPRALLLDEVTSALDPELVGEVLALIRDLKTQGMTMLICDPRDGLRPRGRRRGLLPPRGAHPRAGRAGADLPPPRGAGDPPVPAPRAGGRPTSVSPPARGGASRATLRRASARIRKGAVRCVQRVRVDRVKSWPASADVTGMPHVTSAARRQWWVSSHCSARSAASVAVSPRKIWPVDDGRPGATLTACQPPAGSGAILRRKPAPRKRSRMPASRIPSEVGPSGRPSAPSAQLRTSDQRQITSPPSRPTGAGKPGEATARSTRDRVRCSRRPIAARVTRSCSPSGCSPTGAAKHAAGAARNACGE